MSAPSDEDMWAAALSIGGHEVPLAEVRYESVVREPAEGAPLGAYECRFEGVFEVGDAERRYLVQMAVSGHMRHDSQRFDVALGEYRGVRGALLSGYRATPAGDAVEVEAAMLFSADLLTREWVRTDTGERLAWSPLEAPAAPCVAVGT